LFLSVFLAFYFVNILYPLMLLSFGHRN